MTDTTPLPLVEQSRDIDASPATVWAIFTTPELFSRWMDGEITFEPEPGSPFRAAFPSFQTVVTGEVLVVDEAARHFAVTWGVESGPQAEAFPAGCSRVDFKVLERDRGCTVELTHSELPSEELAAQHRGGWVFHLSRMDLMANRSDLSDGLERTLAGWFSAWNDKDEASRLETLRACCADDVEFRDDWTTASGIDLLNTHISNCFMYMPDWKLEATGDVRVCRGEALVGWRGIGPGGAEIEGYNHVRASPDGTLHRVAGFQSL